jgi:hypothetical protein
MRRLHKLAINNFVQDQRAASTLIGSMPFSDLEIMRISDMLLCPEIRYWKMPSISAGRAILTSFLKSLDYYHDVACITVHPEPLPMSVLSLAEYWSVAGHLDPARGQELSFFFAQECTNDFLWIECDKALRNTAWFERVEQELQAWNMDAHMKILYITYE